MFVVLRMLIERGSIFFSSAPVAQKSVSAHVWCPYSTFDDESSECRLMGRLALLFELSEISYLDLLSAYPLLPPGNRTFPPEYLYPSSQRHPTSPRMQLIPSDHVVASFSSLEHRHSSCYVSMYLALLVSLSLVMPFSKTERPTATSR